MAWVSLRTFSGQAEAQIVAGFLRAQGIDARLPDEAFLAAHPAVGFSARGGHRVEVPEGQRRRARQLLDEREGRQPAEDAPPPRGLLSLIRTRLRGQ